MRIILSSLSVTGHPRVPANTRIEIGRKAVSASHRTTNCCPYRRYAPLRSDVQAHLSSTPDHNISCGEPRSRGLIYQIGRVSAKSLPRATALPHPLLDHE